MGFRETKSAIIRCLKDGNFQHDYRDVSLNKNWLDAGRVSADEVADLLGRCTGAQHESSRHHCDQNTVVHVFKPREGPRIWYIKAYLLEDDDGELTVFISVHPSDYQRPSRPRPGIRR